MTRRKEEPIEAFRQRRSEYSRSSHVRNRERNLARSKAWALANPERRKAARRRQYLSDKEGSHTQSRAWRLAHPQKSLEITKRWQKSNPEKTKQIYKNWVAKNPDKRRATKKQANHKRQAILRGVSHENCTHKITILNRERFCRWCCDKLTDLSRTIDHIIPLARGGKHIPDNLAASCSSCNFSRGAKLIHEWLPNQMFT